MKARYSRAATARRYRLRLLLNAVVCVVLTAVLLDTLAGLRAWRAAGLWTGAAPGPLRRGYDLVASVTAWLGDMAAALATSVGLSEEVGAGLFVVALGGGVLWQARRTLLIAAIMRPGPVSMRQVTDTRTGDPVTPPRAEVMSQLVTHLEKVRVFAPSAMPGDTSSTGALEVLDGGLTNASSNSAAAVRVALRLLRVLRLPPAFNVDLVIRSDGDQVGLLVSVSTSVWSRDRIEECWGEDWPDVTQIAAHIIAAQILSHSRLIRRPPWRHWAGRQLPWRLLHQYQVAKRYAGERRFDLALDAYGQCLRLDPLNVSLRQEMADVYESLSLHIDALALYGSVYAIAPGGSTSPLAELCTSRRSVRRRGLHRTFTRWWTGLADLRYDNIFIDRYRFAVKLGTARTLARQYLKRQSGHLERRSGHRELPRYNGRDERRIELRSRLAPLLGVYRQPYQAKHPGAPVELLDVLSEDEHVREAAIAALEPDAQESATFAELTRFFLYVAERELHLLKEEYTATRQLWLRLNGHRTVLTRASIEMAVQWVEVQRNQVRDGERAKWPTVREHLLAMRGGSGTDAAEAVEETLRRHTAWWRRYRPYEYLDHYNAACAYAQGLQRPELRDVGDRIAQQAIDQLELAARSADSGFLARRREWVLSEDPDLDGLRPRPGFRAFESRFLPGGRTTLPRWDGVSVYLSAAYVVDLLTWAARMMAQRWAALRTDEARSPASVADTLRTDAVLRDLLRELAKERNHWPARVDVIRRAVVLLTAGPAPPVDAPNRMATTPAFPSYPDPLARRVWYTDAIDNVDAFITTMRTLGDEYDALIMEAHGWSIVHPDEGRARGLVRRGALRDAEIDQLIEDRAGVWRRLSRVAERLVDPAARRPDDLVRHADLVRSLPPAWSGIDTLARRRDDDRPPVVYLPWTPDDGDGDDDGSATPRHNGSGAEVAAAVARPSARDAPGGPEGHW